MAIERIGQREISGPISLYSIPYQEIGVINFNIPPNSNVKFAMTSSNTTSAMTIALFDTNGNEIDQFSLYSLDHWQYASWGVSRTRSDQYNFNSGANTIAQIKTNNTSINEEVILIITDPSAADAAASQELIATRTTDSYTFANAYDVYLFGGGGGGGNHSSSHLAAGAGGAGSGYITQGQVPAGTYTLTIGAGGNAASTGGTTSIHNLTAAGGSGGQSSLGNGNPGAGGDGGSGGGGGATGNNQGGGNAGFNGNGGNTGGGGGKPGGAGSGVTVPSDFPYGNKISSNDSNSSYSGGNGGGSAYSVSNGQTRNGIAQGGSGASSNYDSNRNANATGGNGGAGYAIMLEVV